ncbi:MAG: LysR family transcriptional regulator [Paracoccaceae bacterium]
MTLKQLETLVWVADLGGFRRAAKRMNTTQPNVSARIAALEEVLGQRLMHRDAGSVTLTPAGEDVLAHARTVLRATEDLVLAAGDAGRFQGLLRLGVTEMVAFTWLDRFLNQLQQRFPAVQLELTVDRSVILTEMLADRRLDLALQSAPFDRSISGALRLGDYPFVWVGAPGLDLPEGALTLTDLTRVPVLTHARGTFPYDQLSAHLSGQSRGEARRITSTNLAACMRLAENGMGIACLPEVMVREALAQGRLRQLDYSWVPDPLRFSARFDADRGAAFVGQVAQMAVTEDQKFRSL